MTPRYQSIRIRCLSSLIKGKGDWRLGDWVEKRSLVQFNEEIPLSSLGVPSSISVNVSGVGGRILSQS